MVFVQDVAHKGLKPELSWIMVIDICTSKWASRAGKIDTFRNGVGFRTKGPLKRFFYFNCEENRVRSPSKTCVRGCEGRQWQSKSNSQEQMLGETRETLLREKVHLSMNDRQEFQVYDCRTRETVRIENDNNNNWQRSSTKSAFLIWQIDWYWNLVPIKIFWVWSPFV